MSRRGGTEREKKILTFYKGTTTSSLYLTKYTRDSEGMRGRRGERRRTEKHGDKEGEGEEEEEEEGEGEARDAETNFFLYSWISNMTKRHINNNYNTSYNNNKYNSNKYNNSNSSNSNNSNKYNKNQKVGGKVGKGDDHINTRRNKRTTTAARTSTTRIISRYRWARGRRRGTKRGKEISHTKRNEGTAIATEKATTTSFLLSR